MQSTISNEKQLLEIYMLYIIFVSIFSANFYVSMSNCVKEILFVIFFSNI